MQLLCMGALRHGLGAYEPTCTPLATPLVWRHASPEKIVTLDTQRVFLRPSDSDFQAITALDIDSGGYVAS